MVFQSQTVPGEVKTEGRKTERAASSNKITNKEEEGVLDKKKERVTTGAKWAKEEEGERI